jgi:hypothetical protein
MTWVGRFARFWYDFVVGDEWRVAAIVLLAVGATVGAVHLGWNGWLILPLAVAGTLVVSAWRAIRRHQSAA